MGPVTDDTGSKTKQRSGVPRPVGAERGVRTGLLLTLRAFRRAGTEERAPSLGAQTAWIQTLAHTPPRCVASGRLISLSEQMSYLSLAPLPRLPGLQSIAQARLQVDYLIRSSPHPRDGRALKAAPFHRQQSEGPGSEDLQLYVWSWARRAGQRKQSLWVLTNDISSRLRLSL